MELERERKRQGQHLSPTRAGARGRGEGGLPLQGRQRHCRKQARVGQPWIEKADT